MTGLSTQQQVQERLEAIEQDLAAKQNDYEQAAFAWFKAKRDREHDYALAYLGAEGTVDERKSKAIRAIATVGRDEEARYEAMKAAVRVLETRASIGQSILRAQGRS